MNPLDTISNQAKIRRRNRVRQFRTCRTWGAEWGMASYEIPDGRNMHEHGHAVSLRVLAVHLSHVPC